MQIQFSSLNLKPWIQNFVKNYTSVIVMLALTAIGSFVVGMSIDFARRYFKARKVNPLADQTAANVNKINHVSQKIVNPTSPNTPVLDQPQQQPQSQPQAQTQSQLQSQPQADVHLNPEPQPQQQPQLQAQPQLQSQPEQEQQQEQVAQPSQALETSISHLAKQRLDELKAAIKKTIEEQEAEITNNNNHTVEEQHETNDLPHASDNNQQEDQPVPAFPRNRSLTKVSDVIHQKQVQIWGEKVVDGESTSGKPPYTGILPPPPPADASTDTQAQLETPQEDRPDNKDNNNITQGNVASQEDHTLQPQLVVQDHSQIQTVLDNQQIQVPVSVDSDKDKPSGTLSNNQAPLLPPIDQHIISVIIPADQAQQGQQVVIKIPQPDNQDNQAPLPSPVQVVRKERDENNNNTQLDAQLDSSSVVSSPGKKSGFQKLKEMLKRNKSADVVSTKNDKKSERKKRLSKHRSYEGPITKSKSRSKKHRSLDFESDSGSDNPSIGLYENKDAVK